MSNEIMCDDDEIERLRDEIAQWREQAHHWKTNAMQLQDTQWNAREIHAINHRLNDEIELLRETNKRLNRRCQRLESGVKQTVEDCRRQDVTLGRALANCECDRLTADNAKLRDELQNIANANPSQWGEQSDQFQPWAQNRARHALEAKP